MRCRQDRWARLLRLPDGVYSVAIFLEPALSRRAQLKSKFKKTSIGRASIIASLILLLLDAPPDYCFLSIPHFLHFLSRVSPMTEQHALSKDAIALRD